MAIFLIVAYLLSGVLHQCPGTNVTSPVSSGWAVAMSSIQNTDTSGTGLAADHHCHGCFSVTMPTPALVSVRIEPQASAITPPLSHNSELLPGIEPPPPKLLS